MRIILKSLATNHDLHTFMCVFLQNHPRDPRLLFPLVKSLCSVLKKREEHA